MTFILSPKPNWKTDILNGDKKVLQSVLIDKVFPSFEYVTDLFKKSSEIFTFI